MDLKPVKAWEFIGASGVFRLEDPQHTSYLYLPLVNEAGMVAVVTPTQHGDAKTGQHSFLTLPVSVDDLQNNRSCRNFWVYVEGDGVWSATGNSPAQIVAPDAEKVTLTAGFLWQKVTRASAKTGLQAEITNLVPPGDDQVELMQVALTNISSRPLTITPTAAIPIYGRSADNVRDHRHVTSLLQRIHCHAYGVWVQPTLSFDERGHQPNTVTYAVLGADGNGGAPAGFFPVVEDFIGEGGSLDWPQAALDPQQAPVPAGAAFDGFEAMGALRFSRLTLGVGESVRYVLVQAIIPSISQAEENLAKLIQDYASASKFDECLHQTEAYWQDKLANLSFQTGDTRYNLWLKWVAIQPVFRRMFGNSYLPYHDYGRGGRGWRDLWQDLLSLMLMESSPVDALLHSNFAGVRMDGSNATIIGNCPGEFKADRNNIPRVWMDHGAWPLMTTQMYIDQTGDLAFLLRPQVYFKDNHISRCTAHDLEWDAEQGTQQRSVNREIYSGTILEHLLVQHLTAFFHVGEHNNIRLEGADWNDGMDMARKNGESVAFTAFYASNLHQLSQMALELQDLGENEVGLLAELLPLLDTLKGAVDYASPAAKQARLAEYFASVRHTVSGKKVFIKTSDLAADLKAKADWLAEHLRQHEFIRNREGYAWFNGYYDNDGNRLEGDHPKGVRMTLTGQVFQLMGGVASAEQTAEVVRAVDHYLFDPKVGGVRLNTNFGETLLNMGRCFGYAYGHKENGAMFGHMAIMYAYALYERGFIKEGHRVLNAIYRQSVDFQVSRMYPGVPEYFNDRGRGMYPYLTGSASWYLLTLAAKVFGVAGKLGNLSLSPRLLGEQFDAAGDAGLHTLFAGRAIDITYHNSSGLDYGAYRISAVRIDGQPEAGEWQAEAVLPRSSITTLAAGKPHRIEIDLGPIGK